MYKHCVNADELLGAKTILFQRLLTSAGFKSNCKVNQPVLYSDAQLVLKCELLTILYMYDQHHRWCYLLTIIIPLIHIH